MSSRVSQFEIFSIGHLERELTANSVNICALQKELEGPTFARKSVLQDLPNKLVDLCDFEGRTEMMAELKLINGGWINARPQGV